MRFEPRWRIQTVLSDGTRQVGGWRFWTRRGAAQWARLATSGSAGLHVWQPVKVPPMKRAVLGLLRAAVGAVVVMTSWLGTLFDDAEDVWT